MELRPVEPPPPLDAYQTFLARRISDGVLRAVNNLAPAHIGWGVGQVPQHVFNRRWRLQDGKTVMNPFGEPDRALMNPGSARNDLAGPAGPVNPEVYFISVQTPEGRPIALLANYWLHYVGGVPRGHISADYFGAFCDRVQPGRLRNLARHQSRRARDNPKDRGRDQGSVRSVEINHARAGKTRAYPGNESGAA